MSIERIEVKNFKSFKDIKIDIKNFNVLIGANASGKSNFVQIFKFLRDIVIFGLDNAVSLQGGVEYLRNLNIGTSEDLAIKVISSNFEFGFILQPLKEGLMGIEVYKSTYEFALKFNETNSGFTIARDILIQKYKIIELQLEKDKSNKKKKLGDGEIIISRKNGKVNVDIRMPENIQLKKQDIFPPFLLEVELPEHILILQTPHLLTLPLVEIFRNIAIYDFDPKLSKKAVPITGKAELEEDGSNLSIILRNIIQDNNKKRKLFNLVKDLLPFVEDLDVEKFADKSLLFKLKESYFQAQYLPASLISDGTINMTALIVALYFEKKPFIIIEEPERNIHPSLISKISEMMKDASQKKQILITTHNPEFVKYAGLENILLVSRNENGFSTITRPADKKEIKTFLENEIGIEELYIQNLLEI